MAKRLAFGPPKGKNTVAWHGVSTAASMGERCRGLTVVAGLVGWWYGGEARP
jgi:hypothetical protein